MKLARTAVQRVHHQQAIAQQRGIVVIVNHVTARAATQGAEESRFGRGQGKGPPSRRGRLTPCRAHAAITPASDHVFGRGGISRHVFRRLENLCFRGAIQL